MVLLRCSRRSTFRGATYGSSGLEVRSDMVVRIECSPVTGPGLAIVRDKQFPNNPAL